MSRPAAARIHTPSLRHNYRILKRKAGSARVMPVVKANAYGHGLDIVARALAEEGCREYAVTDALEGARLRGLLDEHVGIIVFSGVFDDEDARLSVEHRLIIAVTETEQIARLRRAGFRGRVWIKVDTGMHRLGAEDPATLLEMACGCGMTVAGVMSHLACADEPGHELNRKQLRAFEQVIAALPDELEASLLNSAGIAYMPRHRYDVVRPGIALYGVEPGGQAGLGLKPVMRFSGGVMQLRDISRGESVSYGATFTADRAMRIAVVSVGYADGLPHSLSGGGLAAHGRFRLPIVGRVCMDYCLLDASGTDLEPGAEVEFWGESVPVDEVAETAGTIAYELFTGVGERVRRIALQ